MGFEVRKIQHAKLAESHQESDGLVVLHIARPGLRLLVRSAKGVGQTGMRQRFADQLAGGREHLNVEAFQRDFVSRLHGGVSEFVASGLVESESLAGTGIVRSRTLNFAMIEDVT